MHGEIADAKKGFGILADCPAYVAAFKLARPLVAYTDTLPAKMEAMRDQLYRAVISISANIAEGFGRRIIGSKINFCRNASGSAYEVLNFLLLCPDVPCEIMTQARDVVRLVDELIQELIRSRLA